MVTSQGAYLVRHSSTMSNSLSGCFIYLHVYYCHLYDIIHVPKSTSHILYCHLYRYKGTWDAFNSILKSEGITGLWKGWIPNCQRAAIVCLGGIYSVNVYTYSMFSVNVLHRILNYFPSLYSQCYSNRVSRLYK